MMKYEVTSWWSGLCGCWSWSITTTGLFQLSCHCLRHEKRPSIFQARFFSCFEKRGTTLPFPEQFISLLDMTPCYIYPTKIADDLVPAVTLSTSTAHAPVNQSSPEQMWSPAQRWRLLHANKNYHWFTFRKQISFYIIQRGEPTSELQQHHHQVLLENISA